MALPDSRGATGRLGIAYMYMGQWVPDASGGGLHVGPRIMVVIPHPEDLRGFQPAEGKTAPAQSGR